MKPIHDRMLAILDRKGVERWLDPGDHLDTGGLRALLGPFDPVKWKPTR